MPYLPKRKIAVRSDKHEVKDKNSNKWQRYYQDRRYKKLREWYMNTHLLCQDCLMNGISRPSEELHHLRPISTGATDEEKFNLLLDWEHNFIALCHECHEKRHNHLKKS